MGSNEQKRERVPHAGYLLTGKSPVCWFKLLNWIFCSKMPQNSKIQVHPLKSHPLPCCIPRGYI